MSVNRKEKERRKIKYANAVEAAEKMGEGYASTSIKLPDGFSFFTFKQIGRVKIDILPYQVGEDNEAADPGSYYYLRTFHVHRGLGLEGKSSYICAAKTFKKKCAVCDWAKNQAPDIKEALRPQMRQLFNVRLLTEPDKKYIWDVAYFKSFGAMLREKVLAVEDYATFFYLEGGYNLQLTVAEQSFSGRTFKAVTNIEMLPRKKDYPESVLDEVACLDDILIDMDYDELMAIVESGVSVQKKSQPKDENKDDEERKTAKFRTSDNDSHKKAKDEDEDEDEEDEEDDSENAEESAEDLGIEVGSKVKYKKVEWEVKAISRDGMMLTLEDEDSNIKKAIAPNAVELIEEEEEEEERPAKKSKSPPAKTKVPPGKKKGRDEEDEDEDDDTDDDEDEDEDEDNDD